jgi:hypothetical protein
VVDEPIDGSAGDTASPNTSPQRPNGLSEVDQVGHIAFVAEAANLFFQLISSRDERASILVGRAGTPWPAPWTTSRPRRVRSPKVPDVSRPTLSAEAIPIETMIPDWGHGDPLASAREANAYFAVAMDEDTATRAPASSTCSACATDGPRAPAARRYRTAWAGSGSVGVCW